jgi:hypothetical protein
VLIWYIFPVLVSRTKKNLATLAADLFFVHEKLGRKTDKNKWRWVGPDFFRARDRLVPHPLGSGFFGLEKFTK